MEPTHAPRPEPTRWIERQRKRRQSRLLHLLDQSFALRLLLAALAAMAALGCVNRFEQCRSQRFAPGCLWQDAGGVVSVNNLEALSILTAAFLYILEGGKRRQRELRDAHELILASRQTGVRYAPGRNDAIELLSQAGLELPGWDFSGIDLDLIRVAGARWHGVNLAGSTLHQADLRRVDLGQANLRGADLSGADLRGADLRGADLSDADLSGADLRDARLEDAVLAGTVLTGCRLDDRDT